MTSHASHTNSAPGEVFELYIISSLNEFIVNFPQTRIRYEFDQLSDVHFIEVVPNSVYRLNEEYIEWENEMYDRFVAMYPDQNICFISDDALVELENVQLILTGSEYDLKYSTYIHETVVDESALKITADNRAVWSGESKSKMS